MEIDAAALQVPRDTPTLTELATQRLRDAILGLQLRPGLRLIERDLAEQTGVSRTCIRAALQHLESEGLVERRSRLGLFVTALSEAEARQIYEVRAALESAMARLFVERADAADVSALRTACADVAGAINGGDMRGYAEALARFYNAMLRGSRNDIARRFLEQLHARVTYLRTLTAQRATPKRRLRTLALLRQILSAAEARDADAMASHCSAFVERSARFALRVLADAESLEPLEEH